MKVNKIIIFSVAVLSSACMSCNNNNVTKSHGAIILGDSSTIVTEKDPKKLTDLVTDLQPEILPAATKDTPATKPENEKKPEKAGLKKEPPVEQKPIVATEESADGLKAVFKDVSISIPNIEAKIAGNPNLTNATGAVYTLQSGDLDGNTIHVNGNVTKVSQKYIAISVLKNKLGTLPLDNLTTDSDWKPLKANKNSFRITGLGAESLLFPKGNNATIKNAVNKAATKRKMSHKKVQEWVNSVNSVRSTSQKPMTVTVRSVIWKIEGKDKNGKAFTKQIRVDIPL